MSDDSTLPEIGGRRPIPIMLDRQELLVVRLRAFQIAAVLRRLAQRQPVQSGRIQACRSRRGLVLRLQALRQKADVRRQP